MELIKQHYKFLNIKDKIGKFIKQCVSYQQNKHSTHAKYGEAQAMEPLTAPWTNITIDFVTQLLVLRNPIINYNYDSIFVVVDRFMKAAKFVPF